MSRMVEFVKAIQEGKFICIECGKTESFMNVIENQDGTYICDKCLSMSAEHHLCDGCGAVLSVYSEGCHTVIDGDYEYTYCDNCFKQSLPSCI